VLEYYSKSVSKVIDVTFSDKFYQLSFNERTLKTLFDKFQTGGIEELPLQDVLPKERSATQLRLTLKDMFARCLLISTIVAADEQIDLFNEQILKGTYDESEKVNKDFLAYFKFFRIYLQNDLENFLPTAPAPVERFNTIFKEILKQSSPLKIITPEHLQAFLLESGKKAANAVRTHCKEVVMSSFAEDMKTLEPIIYKNFSDYKKLILLNEEVSLGEQLDKGNDSILKIFSFDNSTRGALSKIR
jgi:hypothetical protein